LDNEQTLPLPKTAFIIDSLKRPEEVEKLRLIYPSGFVLLGVHESEDRRRRHLIDSHGLTEDQADKLITRLRHFQKKGESIGYMGDKRKRLVLEHGYDSKNAAHLIRLLRMCKEFMETGELGVYRIADRDELLSIKRGEWPLTQVKELATQLFEEAKEAKERSTLPDEPDYAKAEGLLIDLLWCHLAPVHYFPPSTKSQAGFRSDIADAT
jgi:hypothetical protein